MKKQNDESISMFSRRFFSFYYKIPKDIQPLEGISKLYYATYFHSYLSLLFLERKFVSLRHMFSDAQEIEDNLQACGKISQQIEEQEFDVEEQ